MNWRFSAGVTIALFILGVAGYLAYHSGTVPFFRGREQTLIDTEDVVVPFRSPSATPTPVATPPLSRFHSIGELSTPGNQHRANGSWPT